MKFLNWLRRSWAEFIQETEREHAEKVAKGEYEDPDPNNLAW